MKPSDPFVTGFSRGTSGPEHQEQEQTKPAQYQQWGLHSSRNCRPRTCSGRGNSSRAKAVPFETRPPETNIGY